MVTHRTRVVMFDARGPKSGTVSSSLWFSFLCRRGNKKTKKNHQGVTCGPEWERCLFHKRTAHLQFGQSVCPGENSAIYRLQPVMAQVPAKGQKNGALHYRKRKPVYQIVRLNAIKQKKKKLSRVH